MKYIVIETSTVTLTRQQVDQTLSHSVEKTPSYADTWIGKLQRIPVFYGLYKQLDGGLLDILLDRKNVDNTSVPTDEILDVNAYESMFKYLKKIETDGEVEIIIFYHPTEKFNDDGSVVFDDDEYLKTFSNTAKKYSIDFIDLSTSFAKSYNEDFVLPHGFVTGEVGTGHLNPAGHKIAAQEIYKKITEKES